MERNINVVTLDFHLLLSLFCFAANAATVTQHTHTTNNSSVNYFCFDLFTNGGFHFSVIRLWEKKLQCLNGSTCSSMNNQSAMKLQGAETKKSKNVFAY